MVRTAYMVKTVPASGVLSDDVYKLHFRNDHKASYRGIATFSGGSCVLLEVADTPEAKLHGLMGRKSLPGCCGMLFMDLTGGSFWMKGCLIPLDIVFLNADNKVSIQYTMVPDDGKKRYPYGPETTAIELPAGFCNRYGIKVGSSCDWRTW